jgi:DNA polymerase III subunit delta
MRIDSERLSGHLANISEANLAPVYLVYGDEPLLVDECCSAIRRRAQELGFSERSVHTVESGFDWNDLYASTQAMSLFAERRVLELRLPGGKPGDTGAKLLAQLAQAPAPDTLLLVIAGKLDKAGRESAWARALDEAGVSVAVWPLEAARLPAWITARLSARKLQAEPGVVELLAYHLEGNLLAAAQEVDKLALLAQDGRVRLTDVEESLSDNARFNVYGLVDACLQGQAAAAARMLASLRAEGVEPILVLWALGRELRAMAQISSQLAEGRAEAGVFQANRVWSNRKSLVTQALRRLRPAHWLALLVRAARIDRVLKGRAEGDVWQELEALALAVCGIRPLATSIDRR